MKPRHASYPKNCPKTQDPKGGSARNFLKMLPAIFGIAAISVLQSGCMLVPIFADDEDANPHKVDHNLRKLQGEQMQRMGNNPNIAPAEYDAFNSRLGNPNGLPPRPASPQELEERLAAEEQAGR